MADEVKEEKIDSPEASEEVKEEVKEEKPKGMLGKLGDAIVPDHDEQLAIISTFVRLGILVWSGGILTLNYVAIPNFPQKNIDPTFIASVFTGVLATFGVQTAKSKQNGNGAKPVPTVSKADMEKLIEKASQTAPAQVIRIEQAPLNLTAAVPPKKEEPPYTM